jgi:hypothetical protein
MDPKDPYLCVDCGYRYASRKELRSHQHEAHFGAVDRGATGTTASGQSGTTPPTGTGGVATP